MRESDDDGTHGFLRSQQEGDGGAGRAAFRLRVWTEDLQECFEGGVGRVGRAAEDAAQRVSPAALDSAGAELSGGADAGVLIRRRRGTACRVRSSQALSRFLTLQGLAARSCKLIKNPMPAHPESAALCRDVAL